MDETTDIPYAALTLARFYAHESCGKCVPCREGGTWLERILQRVVEGHGAPEDLDLMLEVGASICPGAMPHAASAKAGLETAVPFPYKMTTICFVGPSAYVPDPLGADAVPRRVRGQDQAPHADPADRRRGARARRRRRRSARMTDHPKPGENDAPTEAAEAAQSRRPSTTPSPMPRPPTTRPRAGARSERRRHHDQRPADHGPQGRADHRRRRAPRRVHPPLLLAQPDELGRHVPHVPRRGRQRAWSAAHAVVHDHGVAGHEGRHGVGDDEADPGGHPRAAAGQPPAGLPGLRQGRRVPAAGPGVQPRPRREPLRRGEAALREADPDQLARAARSRALHPLRPLHPLRRRGRRRPADQLHQPRAT